MVKEYGMSSKLGQIYVAREKRSRFLDIMPEGCMDVSQATAELIDNEVREIIASQYMVSMDILKARKNVLREGVKILLEKEKIDGDELKDLMQSDQS
jgi:cell division protease FtsH